MVVLKCFDRYKRKMAVNGGSIRNELVKSSQQLIMETFEDDPSFTSGVYFWKLGIETYKNCEPVPIRIFKKSYSSASGVVMKFQTQYNCPIGVGDILYCSRSDEYVICTESFNIGDVHWQGKFALCNWILKWQNKRGDILEYPCQALNATQNTTGEQIATQMVNVTSQYILTLPYDRNTRMIKNPQRFFLDRDPVDPMSYMVTHSDSVMCNFDKGLIRLSVMQCPNNSETDRVDLGICDYFEKEDVKKHNNETDLFVSKSVISYDTLVIKSGGSPQTFTGNFFDNKGRIVKDVETCWKVVCDFSKALNFEEDGNKLTISIDNDKYIDEEFKLVLSDPDGNYSSSVLIKVESLF